MSMTEEKRRYFDTPLGELLKPDWEKAIYFAIFLLAAYSLNWLTFALSPVALV